MLWVPHECLLCFKPTKNLLCCESCIEWDRYWQGLTEVERELERDAMSEYTATADTA